MSVEPIPISEGRSGKDGKTDNGRETGGEGNSGGYGWKNSDRGVVGK